MIRKTLLAAACFSALSGCVSLGPKAPNTLLALTPLAAPAVGSGTAGTIATALVVMEPEADARVAVSRVPVQIDDTNVAYLKEALWIERPARLFQHLLAETIRARGTRFVVEGEPGASNQHLSGRLIDMGYDARSRMAVVRFDAVKEVGGKFETKRFESTAPVADAEAQYVGPALNEAANAVAKQVADWVG